MSKEDYTQVRGDTAPMPDKGGSTAGDFSNSLGDASRADLQRGYSKGGKLDADSDPADCA